MGTLAGCRSRPAPADDEGRVVGADQDGKQGCIQADEEENVSINDDLDTLETWETTENDKWAAMSRLLRKLFVSMGVDIHAEIDA